MKLTWEERWQIQPHIGEMLNGEPMKTTRRFATGIRPTGDRFSGGLMKSQKEKMLGGELYDPLDSQLCAERRRADFGTMYRPPSAR
jgi:hypothetical protein